MALLKISEPGKKSTSEKAKLAVGIDLGTTNSLISSGYLGEVEVFPDSSGQFLLPSVVPVSYTHLTLPTKRIV